MPVWECPGRPPGIDISPGSEDSAKRNREMLRQTVDGIVAEATNGSTFHARPESIRAVLDDWDSSCLALAYHARVAREAELVDDESHSCSGREPSRPRANSLNRIRHTGAYIRALGSRDDQDLVVAPEALQLQAGRDGLSAARIEPHPVRPVQPCGWLLPGRRHLILCRDWRPSGHWRKGKDRIACNRRRQSGYSHWTNGACRQAGRGIPARPLRQHLKGLANVGKIPQLREDLAAIKKMLQRTKQKYSPAEIVLGAVTSRRLQEVSGSWRGSWTRSRIGSAGAITLWWRSCSWWVTSFHTDASVSAPWTSTVVA